jgi:hypothetical protein
MIDSPVLAWILFMMIMTPQAKAAPGYVSPETVPGATTIDTPRAKPLFDSGAIFVDVRNDADWEAGRIPGAIHLELDKAFTALQEVLWIRAHHTHAGYGSESSRSCGSRRPAA